jgi:hypothetical protein
VLIFVFLQLSSMLFFLLSLAVCASANEKERIHTCKCVNISRFNLETKEHELWCIPLLESFKETRHLYKDEVPEGYVSAVSFSQMSTFLKTKQKLTGQRRFLSNCCGPKD